MYWRARRRGACSGIAAQVFVAARDRGPADPDCRWAILQQSRLVCVCWVVRGRL